MKARIINKPSNNKTKEEFINELFYNDLKCEIENIELEKIINSGNKKAVSHDTYSQHFNPSNCRYCMNYNFKTDTCKMNMPNIDPWYTKDNDLTDECEAWDYIYYIKDK